MSGIVKKNISLPKELADELVRYSEMNGVYQSQVVSFALNYLFEHEGRDYPRIEELIGNVIEEKFSLIVNSLDDVKQANNKSLNDFKRAINSVGTDSKVLIEFLNSYSLDKPELKIHSSDLIKSPQLTTAEELVKKRIAKQRQKKLSD